jgi:hypothetical protein
MRRAQMILHRTQVATRSLQELHAAAVAECMRVKLRHPSPPAQRLHDLPDALGCDPACFPSSLWQIDDRDLVEKIVSGHRAAGPVCESEVRDVAVVLGRAETTGCLYGAAKS